MSDPRAPESRAVLERLAAGLIALVFVAHLLSSAVWWDWLFDTAFLVVAAVVAARGRQAGPRSLLLPAYLTVDAAMRLLVSLCLASSMLIVWLALAGLYGTALSMRLREGRIALPWAALVAAPALPLTLAALVPLGCLFLPMLHFYHPDHQDLPPMILSFRQVTVMGPPGRLDLGAELTYRGVQVAFARAAALLLAGVLALHLLRLAALVPAAVALRWMRGAAMGVALWWLLPAKGWHSLDNPADLLFLAGVATLLVLLFGARSARAVGQG